MLQSSIVADLKGLRLHHRDYTRSANPPVLHRKERFVADDYRPRFARLTAREERLGLLDAATTIGTRDGWSRTLSDHRVTIRGHRVLPLPVPDAAAATLPADTAPRPPR